MTPAGDEHKWPEVVPAGSKKGTPPHTPPYYYGGHAPLAKGARIADLEAKLGNAALKREIGAGVLDYWLGILKRDVKDDVKHSDQMKASENLAKFAELIGSDAQKTTINLLRVDPAHLPEEELRRMLEAEEKQKAKENAVDV